MKVLVAVAVAGFALTLPLAGIAQNEHGAHHAPTPAPAATSAMTNGVVKRVDKASGSVTIAHEALSNLGMPAMTMTFLVRDRAWLGSLKEGSRIRFVAENVKGTLTIVAVEQVS
jgi:Cu/Ag efflux protein CusF